MIFKTITTRNEKKMKNPFATFFFTATGAFAIWLAKGLQGAFDDEMVSVDGRSSIKGTVRYLLGFGIWVAILIIASILLTRPTKQKTYKVRTNDKGEIIEIEEVK